MGTTYAKWVWKDLNYKKAFLGVIRGELTILGLVALVALAVHSTK